MERSRSWKRLWRAPAVGFLRQDCILGRYEKRPGHTQLLTEVFRALAAACRIVQCDACATTIRRGFSVGDGRSTRRRRSAPLRTPIRIRHESRQSDGQTRDAVEAHFAAIHADSRESIEVVAMDMWRPYIDAAAT